MKLDVHLHIPTEQYGFVQVDIGEMSPEETKSAYDAYSSAFKPQPINSLPEKEWKRFIERILQGEPNHIDELEKCSPNQKLVINEVKKALKRLEARGGDIQMDDGPGKGESGDWSGQD